MQRLRLVLMGFLALRASCELEISRSYPRDTYTRDSRVMVAAAAEGETAAKKKKTCNPACKSPEICVDGTCSLPASSGTPAPAPPKTSTAQVSPAPGPHSALAVVWVEESLR